MVCTGRVWNKYHDPLPCEAAKFARFSLSQNYIDKIPVIATQIAVILTQKERQRETDSLPSPWLEVILTR